MSMLERYHWPGIVVCMAQPMCMASLLADHRLPGMDCSITKCLTVYTLMP